MQKHVEALALHIYAQQKPLLLLALVYKYRRGGMAPACQPAWETFLSIPNPQPTKFFYMTLSEVQV